MVANAAIDVDCHNVDRDFRITEFKEHDGRQVIDYRALRVRGLDLHEMYLNGLPFDLEGHSSLGIEQRFFLLDLYRVDPRDARIRSLDTKTLKDQEWFLHGFFGDQNVFYLFDVMKLG